MEIDLNGGELFIVFVLLIILVINRVIRMLTYAPKSKYEIWRGHVPQEDIIAMELEHEFFNAHHSALDSKLDQ